MRKASRSGRIQLEKARNDLVRIWLVGAGLAFGLLVIQSILGKYEGQLQEVWSWFVPTVVPTVSLMLGVLSASALAEHEEERSVKQSFFGISKSLSFFYLALLAVTLLLQPLSDKPPVQSYTLSNYWLGPLQGLVVAALGVLFTSQEKARDSASGTGASASSNQLPSDG
jgi:cytochrome bd-type quinol oxidase subunit 2